MRTQGLDAFLLTSHPNILWLTGFTGSSGLCVITPRRGIVVSDPRYAVQSRAEVHGFRRVISARGMFDAVSEHRLLAGCRRVGFESQHVTHAQYRTLRRIFRSVSFRPTDNLVEDLEMVKDDGELALLREAVRISDDAFRHVLPVLRPGVRESDVAAEITYFQRRAGAERDAFETIVAGGERAALPHARASSRQLRAGDLVILDFGCTVGGYSSDLTRTVAVGRASRRSREIYGVVREAQEAAVAAARGEMPARDLDAVARTVIAAAGYGRYFVHSLGHGLGLHVHERPRVSALSTEFLRTGSVITIEPGIYIPGFGGVRIEDDVVLEKNGCRVLNTAPKELIVT
jgi:Xaa-Pro aminopeptidase